MTKARKIDLKAGPPDLDPGTFAPPGAEGTIVYNTGVAIYSATESIKLGNAPHPGRTGAL